MSTHRAMKVERFMPRVRSWEDILFGRPITVVSADQEPGLLRIRASHSSISSIIRNLDHFIIAIRIEILRYQALDLDP
ncbi:hypothetical protein Pmar_PMAR018594 [Perkinsus marinus ATCC 50983]|uniref:Uncharacterized protein n=1 Tax=Perkinsus marinus (strain ATCC 50983 / TXsc) TaxID=423536 RepID=C5L091_PERM5|nr:hypothetical protein Pmar_PMAR018594 [Perkinsus marinus ATCC 50983]EER09949.1 hypothetical protein Pmar_PMAR018594 [Perkinsus marinus ATCC 50983]|eukprot:XP_002778154.1 hypothetical protein Pmar_PMAR018594 [Perkinsus marinus ATCC 50983]